MALAHLLGTNCSRPQCFIATHKPAQSADPPAGSCRTQNDRACFDGSIRVGGRQSSEEIMSGMISTNFHRLHVQLLLPKAEFALHCVTLFLPPRAAEGSFLQGKIRLNQPP
ncbi:hypothetical protein [Polaromonas sp.]|uniref:hypothetical protein n=1 Tax=Polaromonas sp. TaxID=1869339 RepID=UPI0032672C04